MLHARLAASIAVFGVVAACAAPTLPLPPPEADVGPPNEQGIVEVTGTGAEPQAIVICVNEQDDDSLGVARADGDGGFVVRIQAQVGQEITCWYEVGFDRSQPVTKVVPAE